jgi:ubiquitin carboxyl-terminal hydrolase L5
LQFENALRRHNHMGLMHGILKLLAKTNKLDPAKEGAKTKMTERYEKAKAKGESMDED